MEIVPIKLGKAFREQLGWTHFVMFGIDENGIQHVVTHGENASDAKESADFGNRIKKIAEWPEKLRRSKPVERICQNCDYTDTYDRPPYNTIWYCCLEPKKLEIDKEKRACRYFEPR